MSSVRRASSTARKQTHTLTRTFVCALTLRLALIVWGTYQDTHFAVKYTDIDYVVYTDAARHVTEHRSPYARATYRYTPLLAIALTPNVFVHEAFGKVVFSALDVLVGALIAKLCIARGFSEKMAKYAAWAWLFNPFTCTISTRGSCEAITGALMLATVTALSNGRTASAALAYGTVVHFRLYPIIHAIAFVFFLNGDYPRNRKLFRGDLKMTKVLSWVTVENVKFGVVSALTFLSLNWISYVLYGMEFINEALLYHVKRADHRHNFSHWFYGIYLDAHRDAFDAGSAIETVHRVASSMLPMLLVVSFLGVTYAQDLPFALFIQTLAFVAFNKVCTAQYFVWWFTLLPLVLPSLMQSTKRGSLVISLVFWLIAQLHWLAWAYALEFQGAEVFRSLWLASLAFFAANIWLVVTFLRAHTLTPFFARGRIVKMKFF
jgi:GPI mannosyltransferase 1 subunit M